MAEAASERMLGVPSFEIGALQARVDKCAVAVASVHAQVVALDALGVRLGADSGRVDDAIYR